MSHAGSSAFNEPLLHHQRDLADNHSLSSSGSPPGSFRATYWNSREGNLGDFASASSDSVSRTPDQLSSREGQVQSRTSTLFDPFGCSKESTSSNSHRSSIHRNYSGTYSLSKKGPKVFFRRQKSDSRSSLQNVAPGGGGPLQQGSGQQAGGMDWSMQAFSQLVAYSQREGFGYSDNPDATYMTETTDEGLSSSLERIRISSSQSPHRHSPESQGDVHTCAICSRPLQHRSPWSAQRMLVSNMDLPVVGVLACGHVFHADCLERGASEALKHDPPCPQCDCHNDGFEKARTDDGLECANVGSTSVKGRFSKIGPQFWRRSLSSSKLALSGQPDMEKGRSAPEEKGFFQRSFSRKQFPFLARSVKDSSGSRRVNSSAQVSPENQT